MRILIAGKYVPTGHNPIGGLQSWIKTVRAELERRGHDVREWQPGMPLAGTFDLGIVANIKITRPVLNFCRDSVCVSHGIIDAEKPQAVANRYLFVSEGVRDHWGMEGGIIRQPIDLEFWTPGDEPRDFLTRYSYRTAPIHGERVAESLGLPYVHMKGVTHEQARDQIRRSACVFATGRAALEAMACGAPVVIYDHRSSYQGPLMGICYQREMQNSYSGRGGIDPTLEHVTLMARTAMPCRAWVEAHHDARQVVDCLLP